MYLKRDGAKREWRFPTEQEFNDEMNRRHRKEPRDPKHVCQRREARGDGQ